MIRYSLLTGAVLFLLTYAWRDWYKGLCGVILFMAVYGRPDMPTQMFGVPGLNPFNLMLANITLAWFAKRRQEKLRWDMPGHVTLLLLLYLSVILIADARMLADPKNLELTRKELVIEYVLNCLKWVVPGLLLYDGCRSRERFYWGLFAVLGIYFLLALACARNVYPTVSVDELERRSRKILEKQTGYHRVDLAAMLAGAAWGIFAARELFRRPRYRLALLGAALITFYGLLMTAGRAGYGAFAIVALIMCAIRWRRYLVLGPILALVVALVFPSVAGRMFEGIDIEEELTPGESMEEGVDETTVLAGRNLIWPYVIDKIKKNPIFGYGRQAQMRLGLATIARLKFRDDFGHPHNAYLELLLDNGLLGFLPVMGFFAVVLWRSLVLFRDSRSPISIAAGGLAMAMILSWMAASMGSQTFYPRESTVGMWGAMLLLLRVSVERSRVLARERAAQRALRRGPRAAPPPQPAAVPPSPTASSAYARRNRRPRRSWVAELLAETPTPLDGQLWAKPA